MWHSKRPAHRLYCCSDCDNREEKRGQQAILETRRLRVEAFLIAIAIASFLTACWVFKRMATSMNNLLLDGHRTWLDVWQLFLIRSGRCVICGIIRPVHSFNACTFIGQKEEMSDRALKSRWSQKQGRMEADSFHSQTDLWLINKLYSRIALTYFSFL